MITCDKCGADQRVTSAAQAADWGKVSLSEFCGKPVIGTVNSTNPTLISPKDLCPSCTDLLVVWWNAIVPILKPAADTVEITER